MRKKARAIVGAACCVLAVAAVAVVAAAAQKPTAIPNQWRFSADGLDAFPLLDFTPPKQDDKTPKSDPKANQAVSELHGRLSTLASARKWDEARKVLDEMLAKYGSHPRTGNAFDEYIRRLVDDKSKKDEALAACRLLIERFPAYIWSAYHHIRRVTGSYLYFHNAGSTSVEPGKKPRIGLHGRNVDRITFSVYAVDLFKLLDQGISLRAPSVPRGAKPLKTWTVKTQKRNSRWFSQNVDIPVSEPGAYLVTMKTKHYQWVTLSVLSRLAVATKGDGRILMAYAGNVRGGKAPGACDLRILDNTREIFRGKTNPDGLFVGGMKGDAHNALVVVRRGDDFAVSYAQSSCQRHAYGRVFLTTDRPVYRPKQTVHFKLIARRYNLETDGIEFKPGEQVKVTVNDPKGNEALRKEVKTNDFGTATLSMTLGEELPIGRYYVHASGPSASGYGYFDVEAYKKPEYDVSVAVSQGNAVLGDPIGIRIGARYYFGEPVKEAKISYEIYANPYSYSYAWWRYGYAWYHDYYWFAQSYASGRRQVGGQLVGRGEGHLGRDGTFEITFDSKKLDATKNYDYNLTVRASVTDKSRRQIQGYGSVLLARAGVQLAIHPDRYCYRPGEKVTLNLRTSNLDGDGLSAAVRFVVQRRDEHSEYRKLFGETVETNGQGQGAFSFVPDQSGHFRIVATAQDAAKRTVRAECHAWVADRTWRSPYRYAGIDIQTDRQLYRPGDKAQVFITTGHTDHAALLTTEGERIQSYRLARFNGSLLTYDEPIEKAMAPTSAIAVVLFAEGGYVQRQRRLVVPPADKWLKVAVTTDKPQYKPGESAAYTVTLTDHRGEPVEAELSFALVDEAIYAIRPDQTPDIRKFYYGQRRSYVNTQTSFWFRSQGLGGTPTEQGQRAVAAELSQPGTPPRPVAAAPPGRAGRPRAKGAADRVAFVQPRLRTEFADSAVWKPTLIAGKDGKVVVPFKMPDNLTTWRAKIIAITRDGRVGQEVHKIVTRQDLMVRLECPRTFTERDEVTVSAVVHNYLPTAKRCRVSLKNDGGTLSRSRREVDIQLAPGTDQRVDWRLRVDTHKPIQLTVAALTDEESDAMRLTIPVLPHGLRLLEARGGAVDAAARVALTLPADADGRKASLRVSLSPSLAATMFESLEYLANYPYGCVEQTMSRFLPTVVVAQVLQKLDIKNAKLEENLPKYVSKGLQRLYGFQQADGGWGWWKRGKGNPYMTAYVVYGLAKAREADFPVSNSVLSRGIAALAKLIPQEKEPDTRAYMTFAYAQVERPRAKWRDFLYERREKLSDYATALLLLTCHKVGEQQRTQELAAQLEKRAAVTGAICHWGASTRAYHWQSNSIQATAYAMKALVAVQPKHPLLAKTANWLVVKRRGNYWYSTKDTAAAIFALADHMKASGELNPDYDASLTVNGKLVKSLHVAGSALELEPIVFELGPDQLRKGENVVAMTRKGTGSLYYSCALEYYTTGEDIAATSAGLSVTREYRRLVPKEKGNQLTFDRQPLGREVRGGEEIEVRLTVKADKHYRYMMLEDFLPAGCEVVEDKSDLGNRFRYWWYYCSQREARDDRMVFFRDYLNAGEHTFVYTLRSETPGEYHVMPAVASLMYQPDVRGTSPERRLTIFEAQTDQ